MHFAVAHYYRIVEEASVRGPWRVRTAGYSYMLHDNDGQELFAFQWHPQGPSPVTTPHMHLGPALHLPDADLPRVHVPTARVSLEQVVRLAIELGADPRRNDWQDVLKASEESFVQWRSWG